MINFIIRQVQQIERRHHPDISLPLHQILCSRVPHIDLHTWNWKMEAACTEFSIDAGAMWVASSHWWRGGPFPMSARHLDAGVAFHVEWWPRDPVLALWLPPGSALWSYGDPAILGAEDGVDFVISAE
jgi:hypothetical protein